MGWLSSQNALKLLSFMDTLKECFTWVWLLIIPQSAPPLQMKLWGSGIFSKLVQMKNKIKRWLINSISKDTVWDEEILINCVYAMYNYYYYCLLLIIIKSLSVSNSNMCHPWTLLSSLQPKWRQAIEWQKSKYDERNEVSVAIKINVTVGVAVSFLLYLLLTVSDHLH